MLAWPFVALALTFPLLVVQYMRLRRLVFGRIIMVYLVMLYALALLAFTLYPMPDNPVQFCSYHNIIPQIEWLESIMEFRYEGLRAVLQVIMNVVFFMPLGIFIRMMYKISLVFSHFPWFGNFTNDRNGSTHWRFWNLPLQLSII